MLSSMKSFRTCILVLLLGLACNNGRADPTAFVKVNGLNIELFDLNIHDNVVPQMSLKLAESFGSVSKYSIPEASWPPLQEQHIFGSGGTNLRDGTGNATAVLLDSFKEAGVVSTGTGAFAAALSDSYTFTLTPQTRAVFSSLTESVVNASSYGSAIASAGLSGQLTTIPGNPATTFQAFNVWTESGSSKLPVAVETSAGNDPVSGQIAVLGNVYATSALLVPELEQFSMLLAGLGVLAGALRWHRRGRPARRLVRCAIAGALAAGAAVVPGLAQASRGVASVSDFSYELFDLDPADGIRPALTFTTDIVNGALFANTNNEHEPGIPWDEQNFVSDVYGPAAIDKVPGHALLVLTPGGASAEAVAWRGAFSAESSSGYGFTLTPNTRVRFSANARIDVAHDHTFMPPDRSEAAAGLTGEIASFPGRRTHFEDFLQSDQPSSGTSPLAVDAFTGEFAGTGSVRAQASALAIGVAPIPEPAPFSMLAAGLASGCVLLRRHRSRLPR